MDQTILSFFSNLCLPARLYFFMFLTVCVIWTLYWFEFITYVPDHVPSMLLLLISYVLYVFFFVDWTWFLHILCTSGHISLSWCFVMIPVLLCFLVVLFSLTGNKHLRTGAKGFSAYFGG